METILPFISGVQLVIAGLICFAVAFLFNLINGRKNIMTNILGWIASICLILGLIFAALEWVKN